MANTKKWVKLEQVKKGGLESKEDTPIDHNEIEACRKWVSARLTLTQAWAVYDSEKILNLVRHDLEQYVSHGAFITALILCGYVCVPNEMNKNAVFCRIRLKEGMLRQELHALLDKTPLHNELAKAAGFWFKWTPTVSTKLAEFDDDDSSGPGHITSPKPR